jgi:hypothetical protein
MSSYKHKLLRNKRCGSSKCDNPARKRVSFSLGFSASFCEKCADELIQNNLGVEEVHTASSAARDVNIANGGFNLEDGTAT